MHEFTLMFIRYIVYGMGSIVATLATWVLSPFLAASSFFTKDGNLPKFLIYFQTHDANLSEGWISGFYPLTKADGSWVLGSEKMAKWYSKMRWIIRNPAYGFAHHVFGYKKAGSVQSTHFAYGNWDNMATSFELLVHKNANVSVWNRNSFSVRSKIFYSKTRYVRIYVGWKLFRSDADGNVMIVTHINPFRTWKV